MMAILIVATPIVAALLLIGVEILRDVLDRRAARRRSACIADVQVRADDRERVDVIRRRERQLMALDDMGDEFGSVVPLARKAHVVNLDTRRKGPRRPAADVVPIRGPVRDGLGWRRP